MTAEEFIFNTPLYQKVIIDTGDDFVDGIMNVSKRIFEGYNPIQGKETTFEITRGIYDSIDNDGTVSGQYFSVGTSVRPLFFKCKRYGDELKIYVYVNESENFMMKVGQYPSVADIHIGQIKQYGKVLSKDKLKEFTKAIGLAANGVGVGSFVYLRRIFESLIFEIANKEGHIDKSKFEKSRMDEKIELLSDKLPRFLVENKAIYKILSAGIHELSEEECLAHFDVMRVSIELILDERVEALEKENKAQKAKNALSNIAASIKK